MNLHQYGLSFDPMAGRLSAKTAGAMAPTENKRAIITPPYAVISGGVISLLYTAKVGPIGPCINPQKNLPKISKGSFPKAVKIVAIIAPMDM